jgi:hypothetical protein
MEERDGERIRPNGISGREPHNLLKLVGRVTPCAPGLGKTADGLRFMGSLDLQE